MDLALIPPSRRGAILASGENDSAQAYVPGTSIVLISVPVALTSRMIEASSWEAMNRSRSCP